MNTVTYRVRFDGEWQVKELAAGMINRGDMAFYGISINDIEPPAGHSLQLDGKGEPRFIRNASVATESAMQASTRTDAAWEDCTGPVVCTVCGTQHGTCADETPFEAQPDPVTLDGLIADTTFPYWGQDAARLALTKDPIDAAAVLRALADAAELRADTILAGGA